MMKGCKLSESGWVYSIAFSSLQAVQSWSVVVVVRCLRFVVCSSDVVS